MTGRLRTAGAVVALVVLGLLLLWGGAEEETVPPSPPDTSTSARVPPAGRDPATGLPLVTLGSLPAEARRTVQLIDRGGPFPYAKDGAVFGNRERLLPVRRSGWYREYTVATPGEDDRGARRIVTGDGDRELFWTDDHYASFARVQR